MLRQRNKTTDLPLTSHIPSKVDGSGRSIRMEAPIVKAARNASSYTRYSYVWLFGSIFSILYGWHFATSRYGKIVVFVCRNKLIICPIYTHDKYTPTHIVF